MAYKETTLLGFGKYRQQPDEQKVHLEFQYRYTHFPKYVPGFVVAYILIDLDVPLLQLKVNCITLVVLYGQFMMHGQRNIKLKVKQFRNRPGVAQRVSGGLVSQIFMTFGT